MNDFDPSSTEWTDALAIAICAIMAVVCVFAVVA